MLWEAVPDSYTNFQVSNINPATHVLSVPFDKLATLPAGIAAGPDANLWFTDPAANQIGQVVFPTVSITNLNPASIIYGSDDFSR